MRITIPSLILTILLARLGAHAQGTLPEVPPEIGLHVEHAVLAVEALPGSPAEQAEIKPYDQILELDGVRIASASSFIQAIAARPQRSHVNLTAWRDGREQQLEAVLDTYAADPAEGRPDQPRGRLGLRLQDAILVLAVTPDSPADRAGVRPDDRIHAVNSAPIVSVDDAVYRLSGARHRGKATLLLERKGQTVRTTLDLGEPLPYPVSEEDDREALAHFIDLAELGNRIEDEIAQDRNVAVHLYDEDFYRGTVERVVPDLPEPGEALVTLVRRGDLPNANADPIIIVRWKNKETVSGWERGQEVYFRGHVAHIGVAVTEPGIEVLNVVGRDVFKSPGEAFNPVRPILRSRSEVPEGTVPLADLVKAVRADAAAVQAEYEGKTLVFEGCAQRLVAAGNNTYEIHFYPTGRPEVSDDWVIVRTKGDLNRALHGFKRGERLLFRGSLRKATLESTERPNYLDGGTTRESQVKLYLDLQTIIVEKTPL